MCDFPVNDQSWDDEGRDVHAKVARVVHGLELIQQIYIIAQGSSKYKDQHRILIHFVNLEDQRVPASFVPMYRKTNTIP